MDSPLRFGFLPRFVSGSAPRLRPVRLALAFVLLLLGLTALVAPAPAQEGAQQGAAEETGAEAAEDAGETEGEAAPPTTGAASPVYLVRIDSIIHPVAGELLLDAIKEADDANASAIVVEISTPGGLLDTTREMFTAMLGADMPVITYVAPSGAQAASAGFFLLMAGDVAAMAPGTNTGAAHPVGGQGEEIEGPMGEKVEQDAAATIRSLADQKGRNAELAEAAVLESRSFTAEEALEAGLVDLIAPSLQALLVEVDGRTIDKNGRTLTLQTADAELVEVEMSPLRKVLSALAHPNIAYILLSLGFLGLYFELMNPGAMLPGIVGAICLILAFFSLSVLPVNYAGIALIVLSILLFIAEIKVPSFGLLTVGGVISLALGGLMLFKTPVPALRVSLDMIVGVTVFAVVVVAGLVRLAVKAQRNKVTTGSEGLVGEVGQVVAPIDPRGKVFVHGEYWNAIAADPIPVEVPVEVTGVKGMLLTVRPLADALQPPAQQTVEEGAPAERGTESGTGDAGETPPSGPRRS